MKKEFEDMKGAAADPFTRRHSRPTLVTKVSDLCKARFSSDYLENMSNINTSGIG
jgi:hypothetical protein